MSKEGQGVLKHCYNPRFFLCIASSKSSTDLIDVFESSQAVSRPKNFQDTTCINLGDGQPNNRNNSPSIILRL